MITLALTGSASAQGLPDRMTGDWCVGESNVDNQWVYVRAGPNVSTDCSYAGVIHISRNELKSEDSWCKYQKVEQMTHSKVVVQGWCGEIANEKPTHFKRTMQLIGDKLFVRDLGHRVGHSVKISP